MMTHVPMLAYGDVRRVLIIGGGDGGMLREVIRHRSIEQITQVEIDRQVIDLCRTYLPNHSQGAFDDPRVKIVIDDGRHFIENNQEKFDVIISDSTDPIGPGEALFESDFYVQCKRCLTAGGIFVAQNGVPFMQLQEARITARRLQQVFDDWHFYSTAVPTYVGGIMVFSWGTDNRSLRRTESHVLASRYITSGIKTRCYNPDLHEAAFALPQYLLEAIGKEPQDEPRTASRS
jgi:spermidine synthase